ncbi:Ger(x)C family spore germination protein [Ornithinibacillus massiliensis]|uniref:Ger(X)C family spore germination protein n=1 Tax=Ornithinibacillus massiliensis TaxID=1944633 RepID=A0ABS5MHL4_9BACI|nr:Ger(x)C family spore germination protein [Ornithinibacillus massiliensis]MBS3681834.1 Ger(x)C family spore germination protein [Ornithinibacillus massiliensis]
MKNIKQWLTFSFILVLLSGCWSAQELTDITLATAMAIDKDEQGYKITLQVLNPKEIAGDQMTQSSTITTYSTVGTTIMEGFRGLTQVLPRKVNLSHLQLLVYGEEMAYDGIGKTLDVLVRDHEIRTDFTIAIAQGLEGAELISILTPLEEIPAIKVKSNIESSENFWAPTKSVHLDELIQSISTEGKEAILTGLYIIGDVESGTSMKTRQQSGNPTMIYLDGIGVFRGEKLQGWLNENESKGFNYITNNVSNTVGWVPCDNGGTISVEVTDANTDMKASFVNGKPSIDITIEIKGNIGDVECSIDLADQRSIEVVQKKLEQKTAEIIKESVTKAQEFQSDIYGFGNAIKRSNPKEWEKIKDDWSNQFQELEVNVQVQVDIKKSGMVTKSIYDTIKRNTEKVD